MRQHIAIAIAALMITSMAFAVSTTSVSATHATPTISISPDFVKTGESYVFTLSVTNEGGDPIETVEIVNLGSFTSIKSMSKLPKDNLVQSANVTLADGTPVTVVSASVTVPENTDLLVLEGENIFFGSFMVLLEDALVEVPGDTGTSLEPGAEVTVEEEEVAIYTDLRLLADTLIDNENTLPEDTLVELVADSDGTLTVTSDGDDSTVPLSEMDQHFSTAIIDASIGDTTLSGSVALGNFENGSGNDVWYEVGLVSDATYLGYSRLHNKGVYMIALWTGTNYIVHMQNVPGTQPDATGNYLDNGDPYFTTTSPSFDYEIKYHDVTADNGKFDLRIDNGSGWTEWKHYQYAENDVETFYTWSHEQAVAYGYAGDDDLTSARIVSQIFVCSTTTETFTATYGNIEINDVAYELSPRILVTVTEDLTLTADNEVNLANNVVRLVNNVTVNYDNLEFTILAGATITLTGDNSVVLLAGTVVENVSASVTVAKNTDVTILGGTVVTPLASPVPMPEGWTPSVNMWSGTEDNIAVGETVEFPFAATVLGGSSWDIVVKTTDVNDYDALVVITMTSDGEAPIVTATVSPDPTNSAVTITVEASEELSELGEVTVAQAGAAEENIFTITMASADGINWTGTYTVIPDHEGAAVVSIENSTDLVGNAGGENDSVATFEVDTIAPDAPTIPAGVNELPEFTNQPNQLVFGTAIDVAEVLVRVNADVITTTPRTDNGYSVAITLVEGFNEVGVSFVDEAGNASEENVQDVFVDSVAPTVDMVSIAGKAYEKDMPINDNTPTIVVEALDPGYPDTGSGIPLENLTVELDITKLENATPWENSGLFENTYSAGLSDNTYKITVTASDKFGHTKTDNFTFVVDTVAPDPPETPFLSELPTELVDERDHIIRGYAENDSTIKVYAASTLTLIDQGTADSSGYYRFTVTLPKGTHDIYVSATDAAGNESDKVLYGTVTVTITPVPPVDTVAPVVSITAPEAEATTDEASIVIVGKVSELAEWTVSAPSGIQSGTTDSAGNFSASIALVDGTNTIIVTAVDAAGNPSAPVSIEVTRTVVPLETYAIVLVILLVVLVAIAVLKR